MRSRGKQQNCSLAQNPFQFSTGKYFLSDMWSEMWNEILVSTGVNKKYTLMSVFSFFSFSSDNKKSDHLIKSKVLPLGNKGRECIHHIRCNKRRQLSPCFFWIKNDLLQRDAACVPLEKQQKPTLHYYFLFVAALFLIAARASPSLKKHQFCLLRHSAKGRRLDPPLQALPSHGASSAGQRSAA